MKRWLFALTIFLLWAWGTEGVLAQGYSVKAQIADFSSLVSADIDFGLRLFTQLFLEERGKNLLISPYGITSLLRLTYNGAGGKTQEAMARTLGIEGLSSEEINRGSAMLFGNLGAIAREDPAVLLSFAFSIWAQEGICFQPSFLALARDFYEAEIENIDFSDPGALERVNGWVREKTEEKIQKILERIEPQTIMILLNALYFHGLWQVPFDPKETQLMPFTLSDGTKKECFTMFTTGKFLYLEGEGFQAVNLPYGATGRVSMYVFLPQKGQDLETFLSMLHRESWEKWMSHFEKRKGVVILPRFRLEYGRDFKDVLERMGMGIAFGTGADFSNLVSGPAWISKVLHRTIVEVNEEGTEAAGVTAVVIEKGGVEKTFSFVADRPFFFVIQDNETKTIFFLGCFVDPSE